MTRFVPFLFLFCVFPLSNAAPVNVNYSGVSIDGYDTVAYFTEGQPVMGLEHIQTQWNGIVWWFFSEENRDLFISNPEQFAPRFAGHCANGLSDGHLVKGNPKIFRIIDDRLYLFFSWWGKAQWKFDQEAQIKLAEFNWARFSR